MIGATIHTMEQCDLSRKPRPCIHASETINKNTVSLFSVTGTYEKANSKES